MIIQFKNFFIRFNLNNKQKRIDNHHQFHQINITVKCHQISYLMFFADLKEYKTQLTKEKKRTLLKKIKNLFQLLFI